MQCRGHEEHISFVGTPMTGNCCPACLSLPPPVTPSVSLLSHLVHGLTTDDEFEGVESPRWEEAGFQEVRGLSLLVCGMVAPLKGLLFTSGDFSIPRRRVQARKLYRALGWCHCPQALLHIGNSAGKERIFTTTPIPRWA